MRHRSAVLMMCVTASVFSSPYAAAADKCSPILSLRLTSEIQNTYASNSSYNTSLNLCDLKNESECENKSWSAGINIVIPATPPIPLGLSGGSAKEACRSLYTQYCRTEQTSGMESQAIRTARLLLNSKVAERVIGAWQDCITQALGSTKLDSLAVRPIPNELGEFALRVSFPILPPEVAQRPIISKIETGSVITCHPDSLQSVIGIAVAEDGNEVLCNRTSRKKGVLIVRTTWGVRSVEVPAISPPPKSPSKISPTVYYHFYKEYSEIQPATFCLGEQIARETTINVSIAGYWTAYPSGSGFNGPMQSSTVFVVPLGTGIKAPNLDRKAYMAGGVSFTPKENFDVCVQLTPDSLAGTYIMPKAGDPLKIQVTDQRKR